MSLYRDRHRNMPEFDLAATVGAAQRGDTLAMNDLLDHLAPIVRRICTGIAFDQGEDAAQETLIAVLKNLRRLREPAALHGWVRTIATREAVRMAKRRSNERPVADLGQRLPTTGEVGLGVEIADQLAALEPSQRAVLVLRDIEGLDEAQVAELLDVPKGTVKSRLHRARSRFRQGWVG